MRNFLTSYFYYSRGERNGVMVLAILSLSLLALPNIYSLIIKPTSIITNFSSFEHEIATFVEQKAANTEGGRLNNQNNQNNEPVLFPFNPNNATKGDLINLGLSARVATTFVHFREKGGRFFKKEDFKKIYGIKESDYERLEEYITLENDGSFSSKSYDHTPHYYQNNTSKETQRTIELKPFDPNTATEIELLSLGLENKTVKVLLKYREKGGRFRTKDDLKKIYNLSDIDFFRINSFVQIAENQTITKGYLPTIQNTEVLKKTGIQEQVPIDLNRANMEDLLQLRGIGRTFALRILEHRERLGGFTSLNQLKEVYGLPDTTLNSITPFLRLISSPHRKIKINTATIEDLTHPYLIRKQAEVIIRYRINHGAFRNIEDVKKVGVLSENVAEKLKPYIVFD
jgi:competence ComEA-like helix-hairpin-helix protein